MDRIGKVVEESIQLGLEQGLLEETVITIGSQKFTSFNWKSTPGEAVIRMVQTVAPKVIVPMVDAESIAALTKASPLVKDFAKNLALTAELAKQDLKIETSLIPTEEQLEAQRALAVMSGEAPAVKKRGRPKKNQDLTATVPLIVEVLQAGEEAVEASGKNEPVFQAESKSLEEWQKTPEIVQEPEPPKPVIIGLPNPEQEAGFRKRLFAYTGDILPKAGLKNSENQGAAMKFLKFVQDMFPGVQGSKQLTVDQWNELLGYLDKNQHEPDKIVRNINLAAGVTE